MEAYLVINEVDVTISRLGVLQFGFDINILHFLSVEWMKFRILKLLEMGSHKVET